MAGLPHLIYLQNIEINKILWDQSLEKCSNSFVYATSWYLDTITESTWEAIVSEDYKWLMPLPVKKKLGVRYLPTPSLVQQLGIFGQETPSKEIIQLFLQKALERISFIDFNFNYKNAIVEYEDASITSKVNLVLHLKDRLQIIQKNYSENLKRNIAKAKKADLKFSPCSMRNIIALFQKDKGLEMKNATPEWYNKADHIYNASSVRSKGKALGAYNIQGELIAGMFILEWNKRAIFIFSGNSKKGKDTGAMPALIDYYIQNPGEDIDIFDFEGSNDEGLKRFYKSFGSVESNYVHLKINRLPFYLKWLKD